MTECKSASREVLTPETIHVGLVVHLRATSMACDPWLVIGQEGVSPLLGQDGWRLMEMGDQVFNDFATGHPLGKDGFTGRTSVLRPTHLANFHTVKSE